jgi:hypothetical protein
MRARMAVEHQVFRDIEQALFDLHVTMVSEIQIVARAQKQLREIEHMPAEHREAAIQSFRWQLRLLSQTNQMVRDYMDQAVHSSHRLGADE